VLPPESSSPDPAGADPTGHVLLGRFRIEKVLGRGGMGEVLLAHDTLLHRRVALKRLRADGAHGTQDEDSRRATILKEARRASQVTARGIAAIHDVVELGDDVLIVMEYVDGQTLRERLREPFPLESFWNLSSQCVGALGAAHAKGIIHRDIKPENLMLTREQEIKILDFGIARRSEGPTGAAAPEATTTTVERLRGPAGTPAYMAPETHYGGRIDERTDIFSLGAVFYEMLTARHPFAGDATGSILDHIMNRVPAPASELNPVVPAALSSVVAKMLARDPAQRYASCDELAAALTAARAGAFVPDAVGMPGASDRATARAATRLPTRGVAVAVAVAVAVVIAAPFAWRAFSAPRLPRSKHLAILLPATPGATADFTAFAFGSVELLAKRLQRHQVDPDFQMATFQESSDEKLGRVEDARRLFGSNLALVPTLLQTANGLRARLELREPLHSRLVGARTLDVPLDEPRVFADTLYRTALQLLGLRARSASESFDLGVRGAGTLRFLAQGIGRLRMAEAKDDLQPILDDLEMACRAEPDAATARVWLSGAQATLYARSQDSLWLARAEASAREAVALDSMRSETHRGLGMVLGYRKRYTESLAEYGRACELDPTDDDAWYRYGRTWQRLGNADQEKAVYVAASVKRPRAFRPRWWLGTWEFRNGHVEAAMLDYAEMIRRAPDFEKGYSSLGGMLVLKGEYARAIDTLKIAVSLRPTSVAFSNLGTAYFNSGKLAQAVDAYNQAFQFGAPDYNMWINLGDAYYWLRDRPDQAREAYRQGVQLGRETRLGRARQRSSEDPMILATMASTFPKLGQPDSARVYLGQALATDSSNSMVQYCVALTHWQLGDHPRALSWLERSVAGGYPVAWLRDSPVHREWRQEARFRALLTPAQSTSTSNPSPGGGGR
jgi:serine/threonine-protein kinase